MTDAFPTPTFSRCTHRLRSAALVVGLGLTVICAEAASAARRLFNIPASDAPLALRRYVEQSGEQLVFFPDVVRETRTPAVNGTLTAREALDRLIAGTDLRVLRDPANGAVTIVRRRASDPGSPAPAPRNTRPVPDAEADPLVRLSPFTVTSERDHGYTASSTLAGTRLNTALRDTPAAISVFNRDFLDDIGAINVSEALEYSLNGSRDYTDFTGNGAVSNDLLFQLRGFTGASLGRNYFTWSLSSDSYNIERLDFARGPNSILFGIGGPGGIVNTSTKRAPLGTHLTEVRLRIASWNDTRATVDVGRTLVPGMLAARVNLLAQRRDGWREFEHLERSGAALAVTYRPFRHTEVRFDGEYGNVAQVVVQPFPAQERLQPWLEGGRVLSPEFGAAAPGTFTNSSRQFVYDPFGSNGPLSWFGSRVTGSGPTSPALGNNTVAITDPSLLPRDAALTGPGFTGDYYYYNYALFVEQRVGDLVFEAAFNRQSEQREQFRPQVFNDVALRADPNAQLPDGRPNPHAGKFYTDGQLQVDLRDQVRDDYRLTGSYALDLRPRHHALGSHLFSALAARRENRGRNDGLNEVNVTPARDGLYPSDLTHANNLLRRRSYLDFSTSNPELRGLHDPRRHPVRNVNGVTSGLVRTRDASTNDLTRTDSAMFAAQSRLLADRLVLTTGLRRDVQSFWGSTADLNGNGDLNDDRDPIARTFPLRRRLGQANRSSGNTRTFGAVFHASRSISFFYNNANNFVPQSELDINGVLLGNRRGEGEDLGLRLSLLDGRINGTVAYYKTAERNRAVLRDNAFINAINSVWQTLGQVEHSASAASRDRQDTAGQGWEIDVTANPTSNWRLAFNFSRTRQVTRNIMPANGAYVEAHRARWQAGAHLPLAPGFAGVPGTDPVTGNPPTIATAIATIDALYAGFKQAENQSRRQLREYAANVFTRYTLRLPGSWLDGISVGAGL
jgi:iron complex outermembrane receptor protein